MVASNRLPSACTSPYSFTEKTTNAFQAFPNVTAIKIVPHSHINSTDSDPHTQILYLHTPADRRNTKETPNVPHAS